MMLKLQYIAFSTALRYGVNKQQGVNFILGSWQRVNGNKKLRTPALRQVIATFGTQTSTGSYRYHYF